MLQVGDKIRIRGNYILPEGATGICYVDEYVGLTIDKVRTDGSWGWGRDVDFKYWNVTLLPKDYEILSNNLSINHNTMAQPLNPMQEITLDEDTKTLIKGGLLNSDMTISTACINAMDVLQFERDKKALVKIAQKRLDAEKK